MKCDCVVDPFFSLLDNASDGVCRVTLVIFHQLPQVTSNPIIAIINVLQNLAS
jgi:hypothetical protein